MRTLTREQRETLVTEAKMFTASVGSYRIEQLVDHLAPFIEEILDGEESLCVCGHAPIDHHGVDPDEGCAPSWLRAEFERASARAALVPSHAKPNIQPGSSTEAVRRG